MFTLNETGSLPLEGVRVIDFATVIAAPACARVFADLGADVIKVEPIAGDILRTQSLNTPTEDKEHPMFVMANSNKRLISLNLKTEEGHRVMMELLKTADVFISNVRYQSLKKLQLDYETLKTVCPSLIYAHFSGYGYFGPDANIPAYDSTAFWARNGGMRDWIDAKTLPDPSYGFGDYCSAMSLFGNIMTALYAREKNGKGTMVATSLQQNGIWGNSNYVLASQEAYQCPLPREQDEVDAFIYPYECKDGEWIFIIASPFNSHWEKACKVFGLEEYLSDPRFGTIENTRAHGAMGELHRIMEKAMKAHTRDEWKALCDDADICSGPVCRSSEVTKDENAWKNKFLNEVCYDSGTTSAIPVVPVNFSEYRIKPVGKSYAAGHDTEDILKELGYSEEQIASMEADRAIRR